MFILTLAHFIVLAMRGGTLFYYFEYYLSKDHLFNILQGLGLTSAAVGADPGGLWHYLLDTFGLIVDAEKKNLASVGFSLFNMSSQFVTVVGVLFSTFLSIRFGKKTVALVGFSLTNAFMALFILLPADAIGALFILEYIRALAYAPPRSRSCGPCLPTWWTTRNGKHDGAPPGSFTRRFFSASKPA